ncbi:TfoX/Sxy family protein [Aerolutibacter ruishenii]|uniref:TfoX/Sxy family transcriptional regulator of competence genes n=1 Tax=Aerolutibacter ruishenii TaxID=686800 RepID=A0A562LGR3_9GAMM|nr:TfoX/Sxy family protein [Lysobacter ruishenii]TWI06803.1 TfoX/Sxy family transcriptional regulator of competence genes [Lysobacter ruishenii]
MASDLGFVEYVIEQAGLGARLDHKRLFGEYALYLDGKVVAFVCDNSLFLKNTRATKRLVPECPMLPPYSMAKPHPMANELLDEPERLRQVLVAIEAELPAPKPKAKRRRST